MTCLDNFSTGYKHNILEFLDHPKFILIEGDIRDLETCQWQQGQDFVLHQAVYLFQDL